MNDTLYVGIDPGVKTEKQKEKKRWQKLIFII
jgi:hypothetical protein